MIRCISAAAQGWHASVFCGAIRLTRIQQGHGLMPEFTGRPIFIVGNQRSGTRMVANVLNQHHNIVITDEALIFDDLHRLITQADKET